MSLSESFKKVYDLGTSNKDLKGIFAIDNNGGYEKDIDTYMSNLYSNKNLVEEQSYSSVDMYRNFFSTAFSKTRETYKKNALELGAGLGPGTYAMAELFPNLKIVSSELSLQMLLRHKKIGIEKYPQYERNIIRLQMNADQNIFYDNSFDVVFGVAILHHLFNPLQVIKNVGKLLKANGIAIFIEPFEPGHALLRIAYEFALKRYNEGILHLKDCERDYLLNTVYHWSKISDVDTDHSKERLHGIDDKWIFPYDYFDETAKEAGFDLIHKISTTENNSIVNLADIYAKSCGINLSPEVIDIVSTIDNCFSKQQMNSMISTAILVLQKKEQ